MTEVHILSTITLIVNSYLLLGARGVVALAPLLIILYLILIRFVLPHLLKGPRLSSSTLIVSNIVSLIFLLFFALPIITTDQVWNWDEGYYLNAASGFRDFGTYFVRMWRVPEPTNLIIGGGQGYLGVFYLWVLKTFGINVMTGRIFASICIAISLFFLYITGKRVAGSSAAALSILAFVGMSYLPEMISARTDGLSILIYTVYLYLFFKFVECRRALPHLILGLTSFIALEAHLLSVTYILGIASVYIIESLRYRLDTDGKALRYPHLLSFTAGVFISVIGFYFLHLRNGGEAFWLIQSSCYFCFDSIYEKMVVLFRDIVIHSSTEIVLLLTSLLLLFRSSPLKSDIKRILTIFFVALLIFLIKVPPHYEYHLTPLVGIIVGTTFTLSVQSYSKESSRADLGKISLMIICLLLSYLKTIGIVMVPLVGDTGIVNQSYVSCVKNITDEGDTIAMPGPYFASLSEYNNFLSVSRQPFIFVKAKGVSPKDLLDKEAPRIILALDVERGEGHRIFREYAKDPENNYFELYPNFFLKKELEEAANQRCQFN